MLEPVLDILSTIFVSNKNVEEFIKTDVIPFAQNVLDKEFEDKTSAEMFKITIENLMTSRFAEIIKLDKNFEKLDFSNLRKFSLEFADQVIQTAELLVADYSGTKMNELYFDIAKLISSQRKCSQIYFCPRIVYSGDLSIRPLAIRPPKNWAGLSQ